jgi:putative peptidoglycan lipid II flippase
VTGARSLARGGLLVGGAFFISRLLGFVRVFAITSTTHDPATLDPFFQAFRVPDLIFQLVAAGALSSALIPTIATLLAAGEESRAWRVVSAVTNLMLIALAVLAGTLLVFAPQAVQAITPGFTGDRLAQTVELTRIMLLSPILLALGSVATSVLNARGRFAASVMAPIIYNLAIIAGAIFLAGPFGLRGLAIGVVLGSACHLAIQLRPLFAGAGFRYTPTLARDDPETTRTVLLLVPRAIGLGGAQLQLVAATAIGSLLAAGAITAFSVAFAVFQIPIGVIGLPLGIVALPTLSAQVASGAIDEFVDLVGRTFRLMAFVMFPLMFLGIVAAGPIMTVLFGLGRTPPDQLDRYAAVLAAFLVALPSETAIVVLARAFYAMRDTRTPVAAALVAVVVSVAISIVVAPILGAPGLALGIAIASWVEAAALAMLLSRRVPALRVGALLRAIALFAACGALAGAVLWALLAGAHGIVTPGTGRLASVTVNALELAIGGLAAGLVYLGLARLLRIPEVPTIVRLLRTALRRQPAA